MNSLEVQNLTVSYGDVPVLKEVSFSIPTEKITGIIGPNGAGKSTLLQSVMGIIPSRGEVKIFGQQLNSVRHKVAYIPQKDSVDWDFPASVLDVVEMGRYGKKSLFKRLSREDENIALECLQKVDLLEFANRHISELSGGQKQRVFIARALAQEAEIYFMDEPFAGVDAASEKQIMAILLDMQKSGKSIFVVHHDLHTVTEYFDWVVLLNQNVIASGPTKEQFTIENLNKTYEGKFIHPNAIGF